MIKEFVIGSHVYSDPCIKIGERVLVYDPLSDKELYLVAVPKHKSGSSRCSGCHLEYHRKQARCPRVYSDGMVCIMHHSDGILKLSEEVLEEL